MRIARCIKGLLKRIPSRLKLLVWKGAPPAVALLGTRPWTLTLSYYVEPTRGRRGKESLDVLSPGEGIYVWHVQTQQTRRVAGG